VNDVEGTRQNSSVTSDKERQLTNSWLVDWIGGCDCLLKTQDFAKLKNEV